MDIDGMYVSRLLAEKDVTALMRVRPDWFDGKWMDVFNFVSGFYHRHHVLPKPQTVMGKFKLELKKADEPVAYYAEELRKRSMAIALHEGLEKHTAQALGKGDPIGALAGMKEVASEVMHRFVLPVSDAMVMHKSVDQRVKQYAESKKVKGVKGIITPWPSLTSVSMGWCKKRWHAILGRPACGKSFLVCLIAHVAACHGHNVVIASEEMPPDEMAQRIDAIGAKVSINRLAAGKLMPEEEKRFKKWLVRCRDDDTLGKITCYGRNEVSSVMDLGVVADVSGAELVIWDSWHYVAKSLEWKDIYKIAQELKSYAMDSNLPIIGTSHLNATVKKKDKDADQTASAGSDGINKVCDMALHMYQDQDMSNVGEMLLRTKKMRSGQALDELRIRFDLQTMSFEEISSSLMESSVNFGENDEA